MSPVHVRGARSRLRQVVNRVGNRYEDPICGRSFWRFAPGPRERPQAYCPACRSAERHRVLYLFLHRRTDVFKRPMRVLHVAPEAGIQERLREVPAIDYVSTDLDPAAAMVAADLTDLPFEDESFDLVICNHVLEHIPDDVAAMRELRRVLDRRGFAVMQHPIDAGRAETFEDWSVIEPAAREEAFFQNDHVRIYGRDFADRLSEAGFVDITRMKYQDELPRDEIERYRLTQLPSNQPARDIEADVIYTVRPLASH
jgi:Methyltransferase domain